MRIFRSLHRLPAEAHGGVVALGNFDGMHAGHRAVLAETVRMAEAIKAPACVFTFRPHPREFFDPSLAPLSIYPFRTKAELLAEMGIATLFVQHFDEPFARMEAIDFIHLLAKELKVKHVVTGENFTFGHRRGGNAAMLKETSKRLGFGISTVPPVQAPDGSCSSSRIRALLKEGEIVKASLLLGRPYMIGGHVRRGDARGRQLGFPTANLTVQDIFLPAQGVYAVRVKLPDGSLRDGVANLGIRPSFGGVEPRLEVHCFDTPGDLYGKRLSVQLVEHLREERAFEDIEVLKMQIMQDCLQAREVLSRR